MPNPLSNRGVSDRDYAAAVGTLVGEVAANGGLVDFQAIADVIANRIEDSRYVGQYGPTIAGQVLNPKEFSTWSPREKNAYQGAMAGFAATLNPSRAASLSPAIRDRVEKAQQAINDVMVTGVARGITQGATAYHNPDVTAKLGTDAWHNKLENQYGAVQIGAHSFTGHGFRPDDTFDPVTYNGQLGVPPSAVPSFHDTVIPDTPVSPVPSGWVEASAIPDITPATQVGFSLMDLENFSPVDAAPVDFSGVRQGLTESQALANLGLGNQRPSQNVEVRSSPFGLSLDEQVAAYEDRVGPLDQTARTLDSQLGALGIALDADSITTDFTPDPAPGSFGIWGGSGAFNDAFQGGFPDPTFTRDFDAPEEIDPLGPIGMGEAFGIMPDRSYADISAGMYGAPAMSRDTFNAIQDAGFPEAPKQGFSAGFDSGPYGVTPDFSAPSLEARNAVDRFEGAMAVRNASTPSNEDIAASLMAEFSPQVAQTPQAPISPSPVSTPSPSFAAPSAPIGDFVAPETTVAAPRAAPQAASAPSLPSAPSVPSATPSRTQEQVAKDFDLPSFDLPDMGLPSIDLSPRGIGSALGMVDPVDKGFMDAMSNIDAANAYQPGFMDTRLGKGLTGAAVGFATGGPFGAVTQGLWGGLGIGDMFSNAFDRYANAYANLSPVDFAAFGLDGNWTDREPTFDTGMNGGYDGRGGGHVGDGSFSSSSGRNDNNPQGLL